MKPDTHEHDYDPNLAAAMQHVEAPGDLLTRTMVAAEALAAAEAKIAATQAITPARVLAFPKPSAWLHNWSTSAIAAGLILCSILGGVHVHHEHQQAQATHNFETALQIEDQALAHTREQLKHAGISLDQ